MRDLYDFPRNIYVIHDLPLLKWEILVTPGRRVVVDTLADKDFFSIAAGTAPDGEAASNAITRPVAVPVGYWSPPPP